MPLKNRFLNQIKKDINNAKDNKNTNKLKINQKAFKWILLFFPYGLFYMFKNKAFKLPVRIIITLFISIIIIGVSDFLIYPDRLLDTMVKKSITEYIDKNKDMGSFGFIEKVKCEDKSEKQYFLYTSNDKYVIFVNAKNRKAELVAIYEVGHKQKAIYKSNNFSIPKDVFPEVFNFIKNNDYGKIKAVTSTKYPYQTVKTDKGEYNFYCDFGRVDKVYKIENKNKKQIYKISNKDLILKDFEKILSQGKYGELKKIIAYDLEKDGQVEYFETSKGFFKFKKFFNGEIIIYQH